MKFSAFLLLSSTISVSGKVISLTDDNFMELTEGKSVFIKYFAPWCGYCKAMASDWEKLASEWEDNETGLVAEVDCTNEESMEICSEIEGFPSLKWGDPDVLQDYDGPREYEEMAAFAKDYLKPLCGIKNLDLCDDETKALLDKYLTMPIEDIDTMLEDVNTKLEELHVAATEKIDALEEQINAIIDEYEVEGKKIKTESNMHHLVSVLRARSDEMVDINYEMGMNEEL